MNPIQMVDTVTQYRKIKAEIDSAVMQVIESGQYIGGNAVQTFRQDLEKFLNVPYVIPCANGTDALQVALMSLGLKPGDEVITPAFTYFATAEVVALLNLTPVFVDVDPQTFNIDVDQIAAKITPKTKVILPVHLFGQPADMAPLLALAKENGLFVVEDAAQAIGSEYVFPDGTSQKVGTIGDIGTTSFYPSKNLGAFGDGGALFTRDEEFAARITRICNHGVSKNRYLHEVIGVNSRLDGVQAAILSAKLRHLTEYNSARQAAADQYDQLLSGISGLITPYRAPYGNHVFHQYTLRLTAGREVRDAVKSGLDALKIPSMIYYPVPLHLQEAYAPYGYSAGDFPVSEQLSAEVISLPMHSELTSDQIEYIVQHFLAVYQPIYSS
ncbi:MAG: DegT/DnrJ/EryC1/StrS family aminotransferase [Sphingobacteriia bacterium]|nr:DegT/DnrJ/EryC1/StrS family aminotransferase [Sphingobacteriia bacterium]